MKKLTIFMLLLLLIGQTILGPIGMVNASDIGAPPLDEPSGSDNDTGATGDPEIGNIGDQGATGQPEEEPTTPEEEITPPPADDKGEANECDEELEEAECEKDTGMPWTPLVPSQPLTELVVAADLQSQVEMSFIELKVGGVGVTTGNEVYNAPAVGDDTSIHYKFHMGPLDKDYGVGSTFKFNLPGALLVFNKGSLSGQMTKDGIDYEFETDETTKEVTVTFKTELEESQIYDIEFDFNAKFGAFADDSKLDQELEIPIKGGTHITLPLTFKPKVSGETMTKEKKEIERDPDGTAYINWEVWVNRHGEPLTNAKLTDSITDSSKDLGHELSGDITVEAFEVGINGVANTASSTDKKSAFDIDLGTTSSAYKVTYKTKVTREPDDATEEFENTATLTTTNDKNNNATGTATITYGTPLEKTLESGSNKYNAKWSIKYNYLGATLKAGEAQLTDVISPLHKIKYDVSTFKVFRVTLDAQGNESTTVPLVEDQDYTIIEEAQKFVITFGNADTQSAFKVEYETEAVPEFFTSKAGENGRVQNTVTSTNKKIDGGFYEDTPFFTASPGIFKKTQAGVNYNDKTITWKLVITAEKTLTNFNVQDSFTTTNKAGESLTHKLAEVVKVSATNGPVPAYIDENGGTNVGDLGFDWTFGTIPKGTIVTIEYKTKYDINPDGSVATSYDNKAVALWNDSFTETEIKQYKPSNESPTNNNGYKDGAFDHVTQEFTWKIGININKQDINGATLEDTLGDGHNIVIPSGGTLKDQITVQLLDLSNSEKGEAQSPLDSSKWDVEAVTGIDKVTQYKLSFKNLTAAENNKPYIIEYKTKDADDVLGQKTGDKSTYTNDAVLTTKVTKTYDYQGKATIKNANELIGKTAKTNPDDETITWTIDVNQSHSNLGEITLTDVPTSNQKLLTDTFVIRKIVVDTVGNLTNPEVDEAEKNAILATLNTDNGGFTLDLGDLNGKGYQIEYKTFFLGANNEEFSNKASINYEGASSSGTSNSAGDKKNFVYNSSDTNISATKGAFKLHKVGVNPATGTTENLDGIVFELWNKADSIKIEESESNGNGIVLFENIRYGKYLIKEVGTPTGYKTLDPFFIVMGTATDFTLTDNEGAKKLVENILDINMCGEFTLTVIDVDGELLKNITVTLKDKEGNDKFTGTTDNAGILVIPNTVRGGNYDVFEGANKLGDVTIDFTVGNCEGGLDGVTGPSCTVFTITVKDVSGDPRNGVNVTLKDKAGNTIVTSTTVAGGKFTVPSTTKSGMYDVYEGKQFLGEVFVSYKIDCKAEVQQAPTCLNFTLTVKDVDGDISKDKKITIKTENGTLIKTDVTDAFGKIELTQLKADKYKVYDENDKELGTFVVDTTCAAEVQPAPVCTDFVITVKDENGDIRSNVKVTVKDKANNIIATVTTDSGGKFTVPSLDTPAGQYDVFEGELFIGEITVTYKDGNCLDEVKGAPTCTTFTLEVQNKNGLPREAGVKVTIKDSKGNQIAVDDMNGVPNPEFTTTTGGKVALGGLLTLGTYKVYENGNLIGEFTVKDICLAIVKPVSSGGGWNPPTDPGTPGEPSNPGTPGNPGNPGTPGEPGNPGNPSNPGTPGNPGNPSNPGTPGNPGNPGTPGEPGNPGNPGNPGTPGEPGTPGDPGDSENIDTGGDKDEAGNNGNSDKDSDSSIIGTGDENAEGEKLGNTSNPNSINAQGENAAVEKLPQTGEQSLLYMTLLGFVLILMGGIMVGRRKINE